MSIYVYGLVIRCNAPTSSTGIKYGIFFIVGRGVMMGIENQAKTAVLLALLTALLLWIGSLWDVGGLVIAAIIVLLMNGTMYFFSDKIVLWQYQAKEITENQDPKLFAMVREVSRKADIPMPKVYKIPSPQLNAFATGRKPKYAAVAFTNGIINALSPEELKGVTAHELSHIKNRDTLITVIAATVAGVIGFVASMARWAAIFGIGSRDENGPNIIELLVLAIVAPLIALLLQLAISRSREYLADATAAKMLHNSTGLASALHKISGSVQHNHLGMGSPTTSSLFIINPFTAKGLFTLFSTHPPVEERIRRLKAMRF